MQLNEPWQTPARRPARPDRRLFTRLITASKAYLKVVAFSRSHLVFPLSQHRRHPAQFFLVTAIEHSPFLAADRVDLQFDDWLFIYRHAAGTGADVGDLPPLPVAPFA